MKTNRNLLVASILGAVLAISLCAGLASAQVAFRGKFTLPYDVSWQSTVLPAGEYSFTMESPARPVRIIVRGMGKAAIIMAQGISLRSTEKASALTVERRGGKRVVRSLQLAPLSLVLNYQAPSIPKEEFARNADSTNQIPVSTAGQ